MTSITTIKQQFAEVISYSQNIPNPKVDKLFDLWLRAKSEIIDAWNGELIIEMPEPVVFELSDEEKDHRLSEFIDYIDNTYDNDALVRFLSRTRQDFFSNHLSTDYVDDWHFKGKKISKGTKIIRAFKYFETNEKVLDQLQTQASMIIQENKVSGILCFSVHPLDYLSSSENTHHWRSCHALDGEFRAGNLSYMVDKHTIVCYLKSGEQLVKLPRFPETVKWNSKKWRMLLFLGNDLKCIFAGRQYPFFSLKALDILKTPLLESLGVRRPSRWSHWHNDYINEFPRKRTDGVYREFELNGRYISMHATIYKLKDIVKDYEEDALHFNDLLHSSFYRPYYCWDFGGLWDEAPEKTPFMTIGGYVPCLECEEEDISMSECMRCRECELEHGQEENDYFGYCACCESRSYRDDMVYLDEIDDLICRDCYEQHCTQCENCGEVWYSRDLVYDYEHNEMICPNCLSRRREK